MPLTFEDLTDEEQLKFANELEAWARNVRDAWRWKQQRIQEAASAEPPLTGPTLEELTERIEAGYTQRIPAQATPDTIRNPE